jgi:hypothetical protein
VHLIDHDRSGTGRERHRVHAHERQRVGIERDGDVSRRDMRASGTEAIGRRAAEEKDVHERAG